MPKQDAPIPGKALVLQPDTFTSLAGIVRDLRMQHRKYMAMATEVAEELRKAEDELSVFVTNSTRI